MHVGSFKPIVIFFRITNLPAIFQVMMNKILRDLINKRKVTAFVDHSFLFFNHHHLPSFGHDGC